MPKGNAIIAEARRLVRAQERRKVLRRQLAEVDGVIKAARRNLRGLTAAPYPGDGNDQQLPPDWKGKAK